ncbi:hypothetical protein PENSPDRAFT_377296 [Peniophora sp. CONT]|nr:hypothetical protein PENSPDRAFT_377296 [Peniophora sp. CONT]
MPITGPLTLLHELTALQNMTALFSGIYFHELISHLPFDWRLLVLSNGPRTTTAQIAKWTYFVCRVLLVIFGVCAAIASFPNRPDCHALYKLLSGTGFLGVICSSSLLSIRVGAIWKWDKRVVVLVTLNCLATLACAIYLIVTIDSTYDAEIHNCTLTSVHNDLYPAVAVLIGDCTLLALLLVGLRRNWSGARQFRMWHTLWSQGMLYLFLATLVEVPLVGLLIVNLNPVMNTIFVPPEVIILGVGATRMFRSLNTKGPGHNSKHVEHFTDGTSLEVMPSQQEIQLQHLRKG